MSKVAFFELERFRPQQTDWPRILLELKAAGVDGTTIAAVLGVSDSAVEKWRNRGFRPRHDHGAAILAMHATYCITAIRRGDK